jgi:hypothetical protein
MQQMIELFEMASMNETSLRGTEKAAILKAKLALLMFERAMQSFKTEAAEATAVAMQAAA